MNFKIELLCISLKQQNPHVYLHNRDTNIEVTQIITEITINKITKKDSKSTHNKHI